MPGEARIGGNFAGWTREEAYQFIRDALKEEASIIVTENPPAFIEATQGRGRFLRRFELSLEGGPEGVLLRGRVTSPEDWTMHIRRAIVRIAGSSLVTAIGLATIGVSLKSHLDDWPIVAGIALFAVGVTALIMSWALYGNAKLLNQGREIPFWLGSTRQP